MGCVDSNVHALARGGPSFEPARTALAQLLADQGRHEDLIALLDRLGPAAPVNQWVLRGEAHEMAGAPVAAVWDYRDAAHRSDPQQAEEFRARIRHLLDRLPPWELQQVSNQCPFCPEGGYARLRLARLALEAGRVEPAEAMLQDLLADFAGDPVGRGGWEKR